MLTWQTYHILLFDRSPSRNGHRRSDSSVKMSGMDCCCRFLKIVVVIINCFISVSAKTENFLKPFFFFINKLTIYVQMVGIGVIVVGAYGLSITNKIPETGWNILFVSFVIILSLGVLMAVVGFLGCCGAATENQCLLGTVRCWLA